MAKKRIVSVFVALVLVCSAFTMLVACNKATLSSIEVTTAPTKTDYVAGEIFDPAGMVITATYSDDTKKELTADAWDYDKKEKLTLSKGVYEASQTVKISYTEAEVTKTANCKITVHNKVTAATVKSQPANTEYFVGQKFNPAGMQVEITLEDKTKQTIDITTDNAKIAPDGALSSSVDKVVVTVGGFDIEVKIAVLNAIYVEAETGYKNGSLIEQTTGESGSIRTDATTEKAKTGAENLYMAQLKANFAVEQMKKADADFDAEALANTPAEAADLQVNVGGKPVSRLYELTVAWLNNEDNAEAIKAYVESEEFKKAVEDYKASAQYEADYSQYIAHDDGSGENYLGQINQGDVISFVFNSDKATKGNFAFRLASSYLYKDNNGGWLAVIMGDVQFNKLCEFYVNGVKYDIPDDKILEGGMTADGSADNVLWCNWKEVEFDNVDFVAGRNVIELRFKRHGIPAANNYNFAANIDTLLVAPEQNSTAKLDTYDNSKVKLETAVTSMKLEKKGDKVNAVIEGTVAGATGYLGDLLTATVGGVKADIAVAGGKFTATADITALEIGEYTALLGDEQIKGLNVSETPVLVGTASYKLSKAENGTITITVDNENKVVVSNLALGTQIGLEVRDGKVYYVIAGGTYDVEIAGYTESEAKTIIEEQIKAAYYFDLQGNPYMNNGSWSGNWDAYCQNAHVIAVDTANKTFELAVDITALTEYDYTTHCALNSANTGTDGWNDFKPDVESFTDEATLGTLKYTMTYVKGGGNDAYYGCVGIKVVNSSAPALNFNPAMKLEADTANSKVYIVMTGSYANMTEDEVKARFAFDAQVAAGANQNKTTAFDESKVTFTFDSASGTFTVKVDVTDLDTDGAYWMHYASGSDLTCTASEDTVTMNGKVFSFKNTVFSWGNRDLLTVDPVPAE